MSTPAVAELAAAVGRAVAHEFRRQTTVQRHYGVGRALIMGAGAAYVLETEQHWHLPLVALAPATYAGFQAFQHRAALVSALKCMSTGTRALATDDCAVPLHCKTRADYGCWGRPCG